MTLGIQRIWNVTLRTIPTTTKTHSMSQTSEKRSETLTRELKLKKLEKLAKMMMTSLILTKRMEVSA